MKASGVMSLHRLHRFHFIASLPSSLTQPPSRQTHPFGVPHFKNCRCCKGSLWRFSHEKLRAIHSSTSLCSLLFVLSLGLFQCFFFQKGTSQGRRQQLLPSSLGALDTATSKVPSPLWQTEAREHALNRDVASDVCSSCSCCPCVGADSSDKLQPCNPLKGVSKAVFIVISQQGFIPVSDFDASRTTQHSVYGQARRECHKRANAKQSISRALVWSSCLGWLLNPQNKY